MAVYKIKDLENLSGIKAHTIRMWERRYNILKPKRTDTQIREYSDSELIVLLNISLLNKHGVKISKIAELSESDLCNLVKKNELENQESCFDENLLLALIQLDEKLFKKTLQEIIDTYGLEITYINYLIPFLEKIGVMWVVGSINPAQEHFISNLIRQKIISEIDKLDIRENNDLKVLLFLPEHELHELSLLFYNFILKKEGAKTFYLGQMLPYNSLLKTIQQIKPKAIVCSWVTSVEETVCVDFFKELAENVDIPIYVGGKLVKQYYSKLSSKINLIDSFEDLKKIYSKEK